MASKQNSSGRYGGLSTLRSNISQGGKGKNQDETSVIELRGWEDNPGGYTKSYAQRGRTPDLDMGDETASDGSGRRILVRQTVDIQHDIK